VLAVEEINAGGGIKGRKIEVTYEDEPGGSAEKALAAYRKLVSVDRVRLIFGPSWQGELTALAPQASRDGVILATASYAPNLPANVLTVWIDADAEADIAARHVRERFKRAAVLGSSEAWEAKVAARFRDTFVSLGGEVSSYAEPLSTAADVGSEVLKVKQGGPQAVFVSSYLLLARYLREMKKLKIEAPVFSIELDQSVIDSAQGAAEGIVFVRPFTYCTKFARRFRERFGEEPDIPAAQSYDVVYMVAEALKNTDGGFEAMERYLGGIKRFNGASGLISREGGRTTISTRFFAVRGGKIEALP
jgi:branched-chain amino acid transport system substrate-binding protein